MLEVITLNQDSPSVQYLCQKDKRLAKVISMVGPITYRPHDDPYAFLIHEIIEQMLSIKAGAKIYGRLEELCGGEITPENVSALTEEQIHATGTSLRKARCILDLTIGINDGSLKLADLNALSDTEVISKLTTFRGIGNWTSKMYLVFVLDRQDILPYEDAAFLQAYKWVYKTNDVSPASVIKRCKKWKPYSSVAARYLYRALDIGLTKKEFHLFKEQ